MSFLRGKVAIITGGGRAEPLEYGSAGICYSNNFGGRV